VQDFMQAGKPVASIGEGSAILLKTGALGGRTLTSGASLEGDLRKAGANYVDKDVVCDGNLITARTRGDGSAFNREMIRVLADLREHSTDMRKTA
jgi:protease I